MEKTIEKLRANLLENPAVELKESAVWQLPVVTYTVTFKRVKRLKMDILMKMLLLAFNQTDIRRAANLAEMLLVEELFIEDLIQKMLRTGLIQIEKEGYKLTGKGKSQLAEGIVEEEMDEEETSLTYSPVHDAFWPEIEEREEREPLYRYPSERRTTGEQILQALTEMDADRTDEEFQTPVSEVTNFEEQSTSYVPCLEFRLYNKEQDVFYARVWNTHLEHWDEVLEKQIEENERLEWREKWLPADKKRGRL
ncbi:hypothetical protein [Domibacillus robiginosus]|uniref:hypothetical protein n=1 Tax=Domibacillus robiginosus TaxID=1071054 RepID=UPI00067D2AE6|nr:hypothetical protein [Domibacillus robiginosus]